MDRRTIAALLLCAAMSPAQALRPVQELPHGHKSWTMDPRQRGLAVTADRTLWSLVTEHAPLGEMDRERLRLLCSVDGGVSWRHAADTATTDDGEGSLVAEDGRLHLLWNARHGASEFSVYFQTFDPAAGAWIGRPERLLAGTSAENQFYAGDIDVTAAGALVATVQTHARPPEPWRGSWNTGLLIRPAGRRAWEDVLQVNVGRTGGNPQIVVHGDVAHIAYTTTARGFGVYYRSYDTRALRWLTGRDQLVSEPEGDRVSSNTFSMVADLDGRLFVLYAAGDRDPGRGSLVLASALPGSPWTRHVLAEDPLLQSGDFRYPHVGLVNGPGNDVIAIYSKLGEEHRVLYTRVLSASAMTAGSLPGRERAIAREGPGTFVRWNGVRSSRYTSLLYGLVSSRAGAVSALGIEFPVRTTWRSRR